MKLPLLSGNSGWPILALRPAPFLLYYTCSLHCGLNISSLNMPPDSDQKNLSTWYPYYPYLAVIQNLTSVNYKLLISSGPSSVTLGKVITSGSGKKDVIFTTPHTPYVWYMSKPGLSLEYILNTNSSQYLPSHLSHSSEIPSLTVLS